MSDPAVRRAGGCYDLVGMMSLPDGDGPCATGGDTFIHSDPLTRDFVEQYSQGARLTIKTDSYGNKSISVKPFDGVERPLFSGNMIRDEEEKNGIDPKQPPQKKVDPQRPRIRKPKAASAMIASRDDAETLPVASQRRGIEAAPKQQASDESCPSGRCGGCYEPPCTPCSLKEHKAQGFTSSEWAKSWIVWYATKANSDEQNIAVSSLNDYELQLLKLYKEEWGYAPNMEADIRFFDWAKGR